EQLRDPAKIVALEKLLPLRDAGALGQAKDQLAGDARQDRGAVWSGQQLAVEDAEEAGPRPLGQGAVGQVKESFLATGFTGGLGGEDVAEQVGGLDIAAVPAQIGLSDRGATVLPRRFVGVHEL